MILDWQTGALAEGLCRYRSGQFFLAHEHWEGVWLQCEEPERTMLQCLIQIAAAFHHLQRGNRRGAISLLSRALRRLEPYPEELGGVSLRAIRKSVSEWLCILGDMDAVPELPFPPIP